ncbi:hypothetical protein HZH66_013573 [Vespula vulgaris]|uniref:Uncharacterized protein n=1 Tax=Vespula vulgaris TaxID=7454 RepID=A0A834JAP3_VESVU|nr:hypothetical protein HZH66_013573 [Vespula vulgaris]
MFTLRNSKRRSKAAAVAAVAASAAAVAVAVAVAVAAAVVAAPTGFPLFPVLDAGETERAREREGDDAERAERWEWGGWWGDREK